MSIHPGESIPRLGRRTPEPGRVRLAVISLLLLGGCTALLGALLRLWSLSLNVAPTMAGNFFLALNFGVLAAGISSTRSGLRYGPGLRGLFVLSSALAGISLIAMSGIHGALWLLLPLFGLGLSIGALSTAVSWLLFGALTIGSAPAMLNLASVAFGVGAGSVCLLVWATVDQFTMSGVLIVLSIFPLALAALMGLGRGSYRFTLPEPPPTVSWRETANPTAILLALALFFQSACQWAIAGWLTTFLGRKFGMSTAKSLMALAAYWLTLTCARAIAGRLAPLDEKMRSILWATAGALAGCLFLTFTAERSGAVGGAVFLGGAFGVMDALTVRMIGRLYPYYHPGFINGFFSLSLIGGLLAPWLVGYLAAPAGIEVLIWIVAAGSVAVLLTLSVLVLETRITRRAAAHS